MNVPALVASAVLAVLLTPGSGPGQPPPGDPPPKPPPDEFKALLKEIEEAYKAPREVDKDVLDELRKQYRDPTPEREAKIFREIRRLYPLTPEAERAVLRELRLAYDRRSPEQEGRLFAEIRRNGTLPPGTVPDGVQADQAAKLFAKFDQNGDRVLVPDEAPDVLRGGWRQWDQNRDGSIDPEEYGVYYRAQLKSVGEKVAAGEIPLKAAKDVPAPAPAAQAARPADPAPPKAAAPPPLPGWFGTLDADRDGQVQLSEWLRAGRAIADFQTMDLNDDGLLPPDEYRRYVRQNPPGAGPSGGKTPEPPTGMATKGGRPGGKK